MTTLTKKVIIISGITISLSILIYFGFNIYQKSLFDEDSFLKKKYSTTEVDYFSDIAFCNPGLIRKWKSDIKVLIDTTNGITEADIKEVDKVIKVLAPLVKPINISRVHSNGNLIVHLNLMTLSIKKNAKGYATFTDLIRSTTISNAEIFILKYCNSVLMHEFLHALGISHPQKEYPFYTVIGRNTFVILEAQKKDSKYPVNGILFDTWDEFDEFQAKSYNSLSEQERKAVKMLYSSDFKSGLTRRFFLNKVRK